MATEANTPVENIVVINSPALTSPISINHDADRLFESFYGGRTDEEAQEAIEKMKEKMKAMRDEVVESDKVSDAYAAVLKRAETPEELVIMTIIVTNIIEDMKSNPVVSLMQALKKAKAEG